MCRMQPVEAVAHLTAYPALLSRKNSRMFTTKVQGTELFDAYDDFESSDPEDIQATISRESPSPCSKGRKRCSAKHRKSRSRHKKRHISRTAESCSKPSSPPYVRPLITASMPTVPATSPSEQWLLHYKRLKKAKFKCTLLLGHHDTVRSVAVDQNLVVSASDDTTLKSVERASRQGTL
ncbi:hypothetical protein MRX96_034123 [Rhipicephalus microplus]